MLMKQVDMVHLHQKLQFQSKNKQKYENMNNGHVFMSIGIFIAFIGILLSQLKNYKDDK